MTRFVDVPAMVELVKEVGMSQFIGDLALRIERDFARWPDFDKSARVASHSTQGVIELMPVADDQRYAFKYVKMAIIGNGAQSEFQALAFHLHLGIQELALYDEDPSATEKLIHNLQAFPTLNITQAKSAHEAVRFADIVTTITADKAYATIITPDMLEPGMHLNAVGGDCPGKTELHADVLRAATVFVEYEPQTRIEGDIQQMPPDFPVVDLWRAMTGEVKGRENDQQITIFDSVGFALEDYSALNYIYEQSIRRNIGIDIELVPWLDGDDPKDLFGLTQTRQGKKSAKKHLRIA